MSDESFTFIDEAKVPDDFKCCITDQIMRNPVSTADGHTYERQAIEEWFSLGKNTSPATGIVLQSRTLTPNIALKKAIAAYLEELPHLQAMLGKIKDLEACIAIREQDLKSMEAKHANMVPRLDYERLLLRLQRVERDLASALQKGAGTGEYPPSCASGPLSNCAEQAVQAQHSSLCISEEPWRLLFAAQREKLSKEKSAVEFALAETTAKKDALENEVAEHAQESSELDNRIVPMRRKRDAVQEHIVELEAEATAQLAHAKAVKHAIRQLDVKEALAKDAFGWAADHGCDHSDLAANSFPMIMLMYQQAAATCVNTNSTRHAKRQGLTALVLKCNGASMQDLIQAGYSVKHLAEAGCSVQELIDAGFSAADFKEAKIELTTLRVNDVSLSKCKELGYSCLELVDAGWMADDFEQAGIDITSLASDNVPLAKCLNMGYSHGALLVAGIVASQLEAQALSAEACVKMGFRVDWVLTALGARLPSFDAEASCTWIFSDVPKARESNQSLLSDELCFSGARNPLHRYSFKLRVTPNGYKESARGCVSASFIPLPGPDFESCEWPIPCDIRLRILRFDSALEEGAEYVLATSTNNALRTWWQKVAPPEPNSTKGWGPMEFISQRDYMTGSFLLGGDSMVIQAELIAPS